MSGFRTTTAGATQSGRESQPLVAALRRRPRLRSGLIQLTYVALGFALGVVLPQIAGGPTVSTTQLDALFTGLAAGLIAMISVVYGLLFLVVQFGSTTHSPRLNLFRDSPLLWHAFGLFLGTFAFVSATLMATTPGQPVSLVVPTIGFVLLLVSLGVARRLQLSALNSLQLAPILQNVAGLGRAVIEKLYPDPYRPDWTAPMIGPVDSYGIRWPHPPAVLRQIDLPALISVAQRLDGQARLTVQVGDTVWQHQRIIELSTTPGTADERELLAAFEMGIERSFHQDPKLALRLLNDIGLRALSTAINDPYTAIQAIDAIEGLLRLLATRHLDISVVVDSDARPRVRLSMPDWEEFVAAGVDELIHFGQRVPSVCHRLRTLLDNLITVSPPTRVPSLERRRAGLADR